MARLAQGLHWAEGTRLRCLETASSSLGGAGSAVAAASLTPVEEPSHSPALFRRGGEVRTVSWRERAARRLLRITLGPPYLLYLIDGYGPALLTCLGAARAGRLGGVPQEKGWQCVARRKAPGGVRENRGIDGTGDTKTKPEYPLESMTCELYVPIADLDPAPTAGLSRGCPSVPIFLL